MKKIWILLILLCPFVIRAASIEDYYINATLNSNGDLLVEEYVLPKNNTDYWEKNIYYQDNETTENNLDYTSLNNASGIELLTIGSVPKVKNDKEEITGVKEFTKVNVASTGDNNVYLIRNDIDKEYLRIYKTDNEAYYLKYIIKDLAVKYEDIAEIYFNILKNNQDKIKNLKITINLPDNNKAYSFPKGKNVKKGINNNYKLSYQYKDIKENEDIKLRILFNKDIVSNSTKENSNKTLTEILNFEKQNKNIVSDINKFLEVVIVILIIINYSLLVTYTRLSIISYKDIVKILKKKFNKKSIMYLVVSLIIVGGLVFLRILGITLLLLSIIISSYIINRSKKNQKIKYLSTMYILIMFICSLNLIRENNIFYIILSILDIISLYSLSLKTNGKLE